MSKIVIGIDPGLKGSVCILGDPITFHPMPSSPFDLALILSKYPTATTHVFVEKAQAMPGQGSVSMFNYGRGFGEILGVIAALGLSHTLVPPVTWTKVMHKGCYGKDAKAKSLDAVTRLFPHVDLMRTDRCKKPDEGFVDSLLIASYGKKSL